MKFLWLQVPKPQLFWGWVLFFEYNPFLEHRGFLFLSTDGFFF